MTVTNGVGFCGKCGANKLGESGEWQPSTYEPTRAKTEQVEHHLVSDHPAYQCSCGFICGDGMQMAAHIDTNQNTATNDGVVPDDAPELDQIIPTLPAEAYKPTPLDGLDELVRDACSVVPVSKSEYRRRLERLVAQETARARQQAIYGLHHSIMRHELVLGTEPDVAFNYGRIHHWIDEQAELNERTP
jgi:hypothetical protein